MAYRLSPVTRASLHDAPPVCVDCVFWQSRSGRPIVKERWAERLEDDWGAWGTLYHAEAERLLGFVQYGPSGSSPGVRVARGASVAGCGARHVRVPRRPFLALGAPASSSRRSERRATAE